MPKLIPIASFTINHEAYLLKAYLESNDIEAFINDEFMGSEAFLAPTGGVKVLVPDSQVVKAKHLVSEYLEKSSKDECPHCQSTDTELLNSKELGLYRSMMSLIFGRAHYTCHNCRKFFDKKV